MKLILQIALGVSLGILLSFGILFGGTMLTGALSTQQISATLKQPTAQAVVNPPELPVPAAVLPPPAIQPVPGQPIQQVDIRAASETPALPANVRPIPTASVSPADTVAAEELQKQEFAAHQEKLKKDALFKDWYKKPKECFSPNDFGHAVLIKCGNDYARAHSKFEELWQQGKIKDQ